MAKNLNLSLTGKAAAFVKTLEQNGLSDKEIIANALELYKYAWDHNKKLAAVDEENNVQEIVVVEPRK